MELDDAPEALLDNLIDFIEDKNVKYGVENGPKGSNVNYIYLKK